MQQLKDLLLQTPALGLPDPSKPFHLYVHEREGMALGVISQTLGPVRGPWDTYSRDLVQYPKDGQNA